MRTGRDRWFWLKGRDRYNVKGGVVRWEKAAFECRSVCEGDVLKVVHEHTISESLGGYNVLYYRVYAMLEY